MFRNPRENARLGSSKHMLPSTGRAPTPTPPSTEEGNSSTPTLPSPFFAAPKMSSTPAGRMPVLGTIPQSKLSTVKKNGPKPNQSILKFFGKTEKKESSLDNTPSKGTDLFFEECLPQRKESAAHRPSLPTSHDDDDDADADADASRFNEWPTPIKRRKLEADDTPTKSVVRTPSPTGRIMSVNGQGVEDEGEKKGVSIRKPLKHRGGFIDDSSDDDDHHHHKEGQDQAERVVVDGLRHSTQDLLASHATAAIEPPSQPSYVEVTESSRVPLKPPDDDDRDGDSDGDGITSGDARPQLTRQGTSNLPVDEFGPEDFDDEFFPDGEEFMERQYMEEQLAMERAFEDDSKSESGTDGVKTPQTPNESDEIEELEGREAVATCPICNGIMKGMSEAEASSHVNACLDGTAKSLPRPNATPSLGNPDSRPGSKRFQRAAVARPGQANPFSHTTDSSRSKSAFSQLMSGHAEDRAWAAAAVNEVQSRGKPAYERTCPFYKIMPGLYICVDAFRYGKVEGQTAYFLSHFHSDHYIGLTSQWCHGPIYASKVTCNLMRQQLRVDPKWIVPLEFETKVEVPNTQGVHVTMIPANHCPGSSLYLFEKVVGKQRDGSPKMNRILHCGDFRACPAHIHHPLLKPEVVDAVTGQTKNQVIDTCYLDTTYLTPKYSFPSQSDVIEACAQMCVSLSKEIVDAGDAWEVAKIERAGSTMQKFLEAGAAETSPAKPQQQREEDTPVSEVKPKARGRLLVVIGTYSIGKERMCLGIARALDSKIFAPPSKMRICRALEDEELTSRLTSNPLEAQVHMQMLMEIRAETLHDYLVGFRPHFSRVVGFRPTGWSYRPPTSRMTDNPAISTVLHSENWKNRYSMKDLVPQRGSTKESNCFGVPYSEHSSFRELTMFVCALRIGRVVPTVNVGSAKSREKMKAWIERWDMEKKKNGLFRVDDVAEGWGSGDGALSYGV